MASLAISRIGLWGFDLSERQLVQSTVTAEDALPVFSFEKALAELAGLLMLAVSLVAPSVDNFYILVSMSSCAVAVATGLLYFAKRICSVRPDKKIE